MKISFETVLLLGMKCGFIMLNLKQMHSQISGKEQVSKKFKLSPSTDKVMLVAF